MTLVLIPKVLLCHVYCQFLSFLGHLFLGDRRGCLSLCLAIGFLLGMSKFRATFKVIYLFLWICLDLVS
jgi:hypothetical protein